MMSHLHDRLATLPRLDTARATDLQAGCKICGAQARLFDVVDLQKHCGFDNQYMFGLAGIEVAYLRCDNCGFLYTGFFDDWTADEWRRFIYNDDYVRVDPEYTGARSARLAQTMAKCLKGCEASRILDYGSGAGVFTADMRKAGFANIDAYDPFSNPQRPSGHYDIVTCLEVLEHTPSPRSSIADMHALLSPSGCLVFSQSVQPTDIQTIRGAWWYLAPRNGHISTFTVETLAHLLPSPAHVLHGNGWLWAMAPAGVPPSLAAAMSRIGPIVITAELAAPATGHDDRWHPAEAVGGSTFRWTKSDRLEWPLPEPAQYPAHIHLRLPTMLEIRDGFAATCKFTIGGVPARLSATKSAILADARLDHAAGPLVAVCETPVPCSPLELRGAQDARCLGLAVPTTGPR